MDVATTALLTALPPVQCTNVSNPRTCYCSRGDRLPVAEVTAGMVTRTFCCSSGIDKCLYSDIGASVYLFLDKKPLPNGAHLWSIPYGTCENAVLRKERQAKASSASVSSEAASGDLAGIESRSEKVRSLGLTTAGDRSFDDLASKFAANIWGTRKGRLRLDIVIDDIEAATSLRFPPRRELRDEVLDGSQEEEDLAHVWPFDAKPSLNNVKPEEQLVVLDAGGGLGQISSALASMGHKVIISDISTVMLERARATFEAACGHDGICNVTFVHCAAQDLLSDDAAREALGLLPMSAKSEGSVDEVACIDLILFHAVVEWMADPKKALQVLGQLLRPKGHLSVLFYNRNALIWRHLMNGNFDRADDMGGSVATNGSTQLDAGETTSYGNSARRKKKQRAALTPHNPQDGPTLESWMKEDLGLAIRAWSGIRMLHDHIESSKRPGIPYSGLFAAERRWGQIEPYRSLARYIHMLGYREDAK